MHDDSFDLRYRQPRKMLAIIGGSGVYDIAGLTGGTWVKAHSPFGEPSDQVLCGELSGHKLLLLPRHGRGHRISPSKINYRANIDILKRSGATQILSVSAVGSLRDDLAPGTFVIVDQFIDLTRHRLESFFDQSIVAHVSMARPVCSRLSDVVESAATQMGISHVRGGTYVTIEGPQFSTRAESQLYRSWHCDVIGMTNMPEAKLAREAELCYATLAMVTDYDCWHSTHEEVNVQAILATLSENEQRSNTLVSLAVERASFHRPCSSGCSTSLTHAVITSTATRDPESVARLNAIAGRVLK
jgi:5'-methylthioadenosine phosphorylase